MVHDRALPWRSEHSVPATTNPLAAKGVGEAGTTGALAAIMNVIADAVPGAGHMDMPATAEKIWAGLQGPVCITSASLPVYGWRSRSGTPGGHARKVEHRPSAVRASRPAAVNRTLPTSTSL